MTIQLDSEGNQTEQPTWPPEVAPQADCGMGRAGRHTQNRLKRTIIMPLLAFGLPIAAGEVVAHTYVCFTGHNGIGEGTNLSDRIGDILFSCGFYTPLLAAMAPWLVVTRVVWRRSPLLALLVLAGTLVGILWSSFHIAVLSYP
jgi:hypothetical protein